MRDKVFIKNLVLPCTIGVTKEERKEKQNIIVDIEIFCDLSQAGATDDLKKSIDYAEIQEKVTAAITDGKFNLLESLAQTVISIILKNPLASQVTVAAKKEKYGQKPAIGIEITRDRNG
ncbi:MAG TPA: dihydroneopterin aldolase [Candidatus Binatia bacterium]|nr:dihydroneopterin aldolase [Candidatus Binatia bacterium]